jgi:hypothetical protein
MCVRVLGCCCRAVWGAYANSLLPPRPPPPHTHIPPAPLAHQVGNILRELRGAKSGFITSALHIIRRKRRRERLQAVRTRLAWLKVGGCRLHVSAAGMPQPHRSGLSPPFLFCTPPPFPQSIVDVEKQINERLREER